MNKDKWNEVFLNEVNAYYKNNMMVTGPQDWDEEKRKLLKFIANVNKLTETYNLENNIKG